MSTHGSRIAKWTKDTGTSCSTVPRALTRNEVLFLVGHAMSELVEMLQTVERYPGESLKLARELVETDYNEKTSSEETYLQIISNQADAAADNMAYLYHGFAKVGIDLDEVLDEVIDTNDSKRFPDGTFHKNEVGKIIKPPSFVPANIEAVIDRQIKRAVNGESRF